MLCFLILRTPLPSLGPGIYCFCVEFAAIKRQRLYQKVLFPEKRFLVVKTTKVKVRSGLEGNVSGKGKSAAGLIHFWLNNC